MKFVLIFGPPAVGKMTVGQELEALTGLPLFHNHMSIELVRPFFDFGTPGFRRLVDMIRMELFKEVAASDLPGMIFTLVWALDQQEDHDYAEEIFQIFEERNGEIYLLELEADLDERLKRNKDPHRLAHKPSKRDLKLSERALLKHEEQYRFNSLPGEITRRNYLRINSTDLTAHQVALRIANEWKLFPLE